MVDILWDQVEPLLSMVSEKAPEDIVPEVTRKRLMAGDEALMVIQDADLIVGVVVLTVRTLDSGVKALFLPIVAGTDIDNWMHEGFQIVFKIAKQYGCTELRGVSARSGWMRKLKDYGWEEVFTTVRCGLGD